MSHDRRASIPGEERFDGGSHLIDGRHAVDPADDPARLVERQDRRGLGAILGHAGAHGVLVVVGPALELVPAATIASPFDLRPLERVVVALAAAGAGVATGDALNQGILVDLEL